MIAVTSSPMARKARMRGGEDVGVKKLPLSGLSFVVAAELEEEEAEVEVDEKDDSV